jgi:hypothetical protein
MGNELGMEDGRRVVHLRRGAANWNVCNYWLDKNVKLIKLPEITNSLKNAPGVTSHLVGKNGFLTAIVGNFCFSHMLPSTITERALSSAVQYVIGLHEAKLTANIAST